MVFSLNKNRVQIPHESALFDLLLVKLKTLKPLMIFMVVVLDTKPRKVEWLFFLIWNKTHCIIFLLLASLQITWLLHLSEEKQNTFVVLCCGPALLLYTLVKQTFFYIFIKVLQRRTKNQNKPQEQLMDVWKQSKNLLPK